METAAIASLQRRLAEAKCYTGAIDGVASEAVKKAIATCPDQRPFLRVETGMHAASIRSIATDAQCRLLATGSEDKTVRLWTPDGLLLRTLRIPIGQGKWGKVGALAVSPDGKTVAVGGLDAAGELTGVIGIYLIDTETGRSVRRIGAFGETVTGLAFSPDGARLAAAVFSGEGIRIFDVSTGRELSADRDFGKEDAYGIAFGPSGVLFAAAFDGSLRRYGPDGRLTARVQTRGGKQPFSIAVDPTGQRVSVGFFDTGAVDIYDANDLRFRRDADTAGVVIDNAVTAWSADGQRLYASGRIGDPSKIRVLTPEGRQRGSDLTVSRNTVLSLVPCGDGIVFSAADPVFGRVAPDGAVKILARSQKADMRDKRKDAFSASTDGRRVRFGLGYGIDTPVLFNLALGTLTDSPARPPDFITPDTTSLPVADWEGGLKPTVRGKPIQLKISETSRSLATRSDKGGFVLGADFEVAAFRSSGVAIWRKDSPGNVWGVNLVRSGDQVVTANDDGTIRWYRWRDGQELLAFFVNRDTRAWVAWTPTGYYTASPGGENMIGWHANRGWEQPADFFPASKFRDAYARPDVIERVLVTMDESEALRQADAVRSVRAAPKSIADILPPVAAILSPASGSTISGDTVRVEYSVRSPSGLPVDAVGAMINGRPASGERGLSRPADETSGLRECLSRFGETSRPIDGPRECRGSITINLPPGTNEIGLFARTGERAGDVVKVTLTRAAAARGQELQKPKLYAVVVGISSYENTAYTLEYAAKDARDFAAALQNQKGGIYEDVNVRMLTDEKASVKGIREGLDWLAKQVTGQDVGLVYLAGHGTLDDQQTFYFIAADSDVDRLRTTALPRDDIQAVLDRISGKALLFLDACHSGAVGFIGSRRGALDINGVANDFSRSERGVVMFTASTGKQVSQENAAWGNGAFTKAVIEALGLPGLKAKADFLGTGRISTSALDAYVSERVRALTDGRQSPIMIRPGTVPDFALAAVRP